MSGTLQWQCNYMAHLLYLTSGWFSFGNVHQPANMTLRPKMTAQPFLKDIKSREVISNNGFHMNSWVRQRSGWESAEEQTMKWSEQSVPTKCSPNGFCCHSSHVLYSWSSNNRALQGTMLAQNEGELDTEPRNHLSKTQTEELELRMKEFQRDDLSKSGWNLIHINLTQFIYFSELLKLMGT